MTTKEQVWRAILTGRRAGQLEWQQKQLAGGLDLPVSTVHEALRIPRRAGAVHVHPRGFVLADWRKLLLIWAVFRNLATDTAWQARLRLPAGRVEGEMIPEALFTGPSGFKFRYGFAPAEYDRVMVYVKDEHLPKLQERFAPYLDPRRGQTVLTALNPDPRLPGELPPEQLYADLWQMHPWWAAEFIRALEEKLDG